MSWCLPWCSQCHKFLSSTKYCVAWLTNVLRSSFDNSSGCCRVMRKHFIVNSFASSAIVVSDRGMVCLSDEDIAVSRNARNTGKQYGGVTVGERHTSHVIWAPAASIVNARSLSKVRPNEYAQSSQSSWSSASGTSSSAAGLLERPLAPLCFAVGTWTRLIGNKSIPAIHRFMATLGCKSRLLIIPLIYFVSTSTIRLVTPKIKMCMVCSTRNSPYNSSFTWEYRLSTSLSVMEPKRFG